MIREVAFEERDDGGLDQGYLTVDAESWSGARHVGEV